MVNSHSKSVFNSAYNIERYFEIPLDKDILSQISKDVKEDMKEKIIIIPDYTPPPPPPVY